MKTLRIIILSLFVGSAMMSLANTTTFNSLPYEKIIYLDFEQAMLVPGLATAMHRQLEGSFLYKNKPDYTVDVVYADHIFKITGTYEQWVLFFWPKVVTLVNGRSDLRIR